MTGAPARPNVLVACLGNPDRGDDGVGPAIAQRLKNELPENAALIVRGGDMISLIEEFEGFDSLIFVDAAQDMGSPGRIHRLDLSSSELPREITLASTHGVGLAEAIELARALKRAPPAIIVYAVEGSCFNAGAAMTPEVVAAASKLAREVAAEIR